MAVELVASCLTHQSNNLGRKAHTAEHRSSLKIGISSVRIGNFRHTPLNFISDVVVFLAQGQFQI